MMLATAPSQEMAQGQTQQDIPTQSKQQASAAQSAAPSQSAPSNAQNSPSNAEAPADRAPATNAELPASMADKNIVEIVSNSNQFTTLLAALNETGLTDMLRSQGNKTLFAPTNEAFAKLPADQVQKVLENKDELRKLLLNHIVNSDMSGAQVFSAGQINTAAQGSHLTIRTEGQQTFINDAKVLKADVKASNGTIHVIDSVLLPKY